MGGDQVGEQLAFSASGPAAGEPLVFLHGITANRYGSALSVTERRLQALIPGSTVEVWDGLGHFVQLVDPERTADRIAAFVDGLG